MFSEQDSLVEYMYCNFFFHFVDALTLSDISSDEKFLIFIQFTLTEIVLWSVLSVSCLRNLCLFQNYEDILCVFFKCFIDPLHPFRSAVHLEFIFCVCFEVGVFFFPPPGCPVALAPFRTFVMTQVTIIVGFNFVIHAVPLSYLFLALLFN